jgi:hypothetical protein
MANCRSCGAEILWVISKASGKAMPLDVPPEKRAIIVEVDKHGIPVTEIREAYTSHFATCPQANDWRRAR